MTNPSHTGGVVDPSILEVDADNIVPVPHDVQGQATLDRLGGDGDSEAPAFETQEDAQGQTELVVTPTGNEMIGHNQPPPSAEEMRKDVFRDINRLGKASGEGASALGRFGLRLLRAAADGVLSTAKPAGGGKDDATLVYEAYTAMDSKHSEHTAGGAKANASKSRQIIGLGCMTTLSFDEIVGIGDRVVTIRDAMEAAELKPKSLFAGLVDVAREQQGSDSLLSDEAIQGCLTKVTKDKSLEKEWEAIQKRVDGLVTGEASHGLKDQSEGALKIAELIAEHVKNFKADGARNEMIEALMEHGYTRVMATAIVDKKLEA